MIFNEIEINLHLFDSINYSFDTFFALKRVDSLAFISFIIICKTYIEYEWPFRTAYNFEYPYFESNFWQVQNLIKSLPLDKGTNIDG